MAEHEDRVGGFHGEGSITNKQRPTASTANAGPAVRQNRKALADIEEKLKEIITAIEDGGYSRPLMTRCASWRRSRTS